MLTTFTFNDMNELKTKLRQVQTNQNHANHSRHTEEKSQKIIKSRSHNNFNKGSNARPRIRAVDISVGGMNSNSNNNQSNRFSHQDSKNILDINININSNINIETNNMKKTKADTGSTSYNPGYQNTNISSNNHFTTNNINGFPSVSLSTSFSQVTNNFSHIGNNIRNNFFPSSTNTAATAASASSNSSMSSTSRKPSNYSQFNSDNKTMKSKTNKTTKINFSGMNKSNTMNLGDLERSFSQLVEHGTLPPSVFQNTRNFLCKRNSSLDENYVLSENSEAIIREGDGSTVNKKFLTQKKSINRKQNIELTKEFLEKQRTMPATKLDRFLADTFTLENRTSSPDLNSNPIPDPKHMARYNNPHPMYKYDDISEIQKPAVEKTELNRLGSYDQNTQNDISNTLSKNFRKVTSLYDLGPTASSLFSGKILASNNNDKNQVSKNIVTKDNRRPVEILVQKKKHSNKNSNSNNHKNRNYNYNAAIDPTSTSSSLSSRTISDFNPILPNYTSTPLEPDMHIFGSDSRQRNGSADTAKEIRGNFQESLARWSRVNDMPLHNSLRRGPFWLG